MIKIVIVCLALMVCRTSQHEKKNHCTDCKAIDNKECRDGDCYCKDGYQVKPVSRSSWTCVDTKCSSDTDCKYSVDPNRHCDGHGMCVCNVNYSEDWDSGRICTYDGSGSTSLIGTKFGIIWLVAVTSIIMV